MINHELQVQVRSSHFLLLYDKKSHVNSLCSVMSLVLFIV